MCAYNHAPEQYTVSLASSQCPHFDGARRKRSGLKKRLLLAYYQLFVNWFVHPTWTKDKIHVSSSLCMHHNILHTISLLFMCTLTRRNSIHSLLKALLNMVVYLHWRWLPYYPVISNTCTYTCNCIISSHLDAIYSSISPSAPNTYTLSSTVHFTRKDSNYMKPSSKALDLLGV